MRHACFEHKRHLKYKRAMCLKSRPLLVLTFTTRFQNIMISSINLQNYFHFKSHQL